MKLSKLLILIVSFILAMAATAALFPTGLVGHGNAGEMIAMIFLTVGFKATIDYFLMRRRKKKEANQKPLT